MGKFLDVARAILDQSEKPLRISEIIEIAREQELLSFSGGATPHQTLKAKICEDINKKQSNSDFKRVAPGIFALREFEGEEYSGRKFIKRISKGEKVLVVNRSDLEKVGIFHGIKKTGYTKYTDLVLNKDITYFTPRISAESDPTKKQILSYVLVEKNNNILKFVRGVYTNAHSMLRGSLCIGFGGHVQESDVDMFEAIDGDNGYMTSVRRELYEELNLPDKYITQDTLKIIGVLNDDSSQVGKSHLAIIHKLNLDGLKITDVKKLKGEKSINQLSFVPISHLGVDFEKYEYWSKLCIKAFWGQHLEIGCSIRNVKNFALKAHSRVIVIVGAIGSGKTEASRVLEKNFGYSYVSSGQVLQVLMKSPKLNSIGRKKFQNRAFRFISEEDGHVKLASRIVEICNEKPEKNFVIDGIRNINTYNLIKTKLGSDCSLVFVESTPDNCYQFFNHREVGGDGNIDQAQFYEFVNHPVEQDIRVLLGKANVVIYNHGTLQSFKKTIRNYFNLELSNG